MTGERHPLDAVSLIAGALFVAVAALGLSDQLTELDPGMLSWVLPAALVLVGLVVLLQGLRDRGAEGDAPADGPGDAPDGDG